MTPVSLSLNLEFTDNFEPLSNFNRQVQITDDDTNWASEKKVTVIVSWTDPTGSHESKLTTILTKK